MPTSSASATTLPSWRSRPARELRLDGLRTRLVRRLGGRRRLDHQNQYPRLVADVSGDGKADLVGFGDAGVYVALSNGNGPSVAGSGAAFVRQFDCSRGLAERRRLSTRLADVNGDDKADCGLRLRWRVRGAGDRRRHFGSAFLALNSFGASAVGGGWLSNNGYPRELADVNGDGRADIVGFGGARVYVALGQTDGTFGAPTADIQSFGHDVSAGGWSSQNLYPRVLGDVTGDHQADIVAFGSAGVFVSQHNDFALV